MAADALVLTAYYKVVDDVSDEHAAKRAASFTIQGLLHRASAKARGHLPDIQAVLHEQTLRQAELEAQHCADPDFAADPTAQMTAALFRLAAAQPEQADVLARMGMLLGKILYYLDAAEDFEHDQKAGRYNVFHEMGLSREAMVEQVKLLCRMCAGEAARCYQQLSLTKEVHKALVENILFLGLPQSIAQAGTKRTKKPSTHLSSVNGKEIT